MRNWKILAFLLLLSLLGWRMHATKYQRQLVDAITQADSIVITEHSDSWDFAMGEYSWEEFGFPQYEYRRVELSRSEVGRFKSCIPGMPIALRPRSACTFEPHHSIQFIKNGAVTGTMKVCFLCGEVQWDRNQGHYPEALVRELRILIERNGLEPDRDWSSLVKEQIKNHSTDQPTLAIQ